MDIQPTDEMKWDDELSEELSELIGDYVWSVDDDEGRENIGRIIALVEQDVARRLLSDEAVAEVERKTKFSPRVTRQITNAALAAIGISTEVEQ